MLKLALIYRIFKGILLIIFILGLTPLSYAVQDKLNLDDSTFSKDINELYIYIYSNNLIINRNDNTATYQGQVIVNFRDGILKTDILKIFYKNNPDGTKIEKIIIPEQLKLERITDQEVIIASNALYEMEKERIILGGNVIAERKGHILKTNRLVYYLPINKKNN